MKSLHPESLRCSAAKIKDLPTKYSFVSTRRYIFATELNLNWLKTTNMIGTRLLSTEKGLSKRQQLSARITLISLMFLLAMVFSANTSGWAQIALRGTATSSTSTSASVTITKPTGVVAGDIMFANIGNYLNGAQSTATCSGWTAIAGTDVDRGRATLLYKIAGSSEPSNYVFSVTSGSSLTTGAIVAFSGVDNTTPFDVTNPSSWYTATSTTLSSIPSITTVNSGAAILMFGNCSRIGTPTTGANFTGGGWTTTDPSSLTELYDVGHNGTSNAPVIGAAWATKSSIGATGLGGLNCNVNTTPRILAGITIALRRCVTASAGVSLVPICKGQTTVALGGSVGGSATGGTWSDGGLGGVFTPSATTLNATYSPPASFTGTVNLTLTSSGGGCGVASSSKTLLVNPTPTATSATASLSTSCGTASVNLTSTATGSSSTLAFQGFESSGSTVSYTSVGGATKSGTSGSGDRPASVSFVNSGTQAYWVNNGTAVITTSNITGVSNFSSKKVVLDVAAFSIASTTNGLDATDSVLVEISLDGGTTFSKELVLRGNNQAYWGFTTGTGVASTTYDGNNVAAVFAPSGGAARTTDGYSNLEVLLPNSAAQVMVRISMVNNAAGEAWVVDDISLSSDLSALTYAWSSSPSGFTSAVQNPSAVSASSTTTYTVVASNSAGCTSTANVTVTVNAVPSAPSANNGARCGTGTLSISGTVNAGETIDWYAAASGGVSLLVGNTSFTTPSISVTTTYYAQARNTTTGCLSPTRTPVVASINSAPSVSAPATPSALCAGSSYNPTAPSVTINGSAVTSQGWQLETAVASGAYAALTVPYTVAFADNSKRVRYTTTNGCGTTNSATVTLTINDVPTVATVATPSALCAGSSYNPTAPTVSANGSTITAQGWQLETAVGSGTYASLTVPYTVASADNNKRVRYTATNACGLNSSTTVVLTVFPSSIAGTVSGGTSVCPNANSTVLTLTGNTGSVQWQSSLNNSVFTDIPSATAATYTVSNINTTTYYRAVVTSASCPSANTASVMMSILPTPSVVDVTTCTGGSGSMQVVCGNQTGLTSGNNDAGTGSNVTGIGTVDWGTPANIAGPGSAGMSVATNATTRYLQGLNYGFSIPLNATITGITLTISRSTSGTTSPLLRDNRVSLVKGGSIQTTNYAVTGTNWPGSLTEATYGGASDLWGTTWTPADVNAGNFGAALSAVNSNNTSTSTATVDYMRITITYSLPGSSAWYTAISGGTSIGSGTSFNPIGVAGSGLSNSNSVGTTTYYVDCSTLGNSCRAAVNFNVIQNTNPGAITGATAVCSGFNSTGLTASGYSGSVQWQSSTNNSTFNNLVGAQSASYTASNLSTTTYYRLMVSSGICVNYSASAAITVNSAPAINNMTAKSCTGESFDATPLNVINGSIPAGTTYSWSAPTGAGFTGATSGNALNSLIQTLVLTGASPAIINYTVTPSIGNCQGASFNIAVTVNPLPSLAITADYCTIGGTAVLSATPGLAGYIWSTGQTGQTLNVQQAGVYGVTGVDVNGCAGTATLGVATELVVNGNFNQGNAGFNTGYTYVANGPGNTELIPEGTYGIAANANTMHPSFYGTDHTNGTGNFMIINGSGSLTTIWSQNSIAVQPNTTYYFSAWGLTLVNSNNAALQFSINGSQVGTIAYLPNGYSNTAGPYSWTRFYGQWNSGNNTSVDLSIVNLQLAPSGNDFGLDDISFGTFAPVGLGITPAANGGGAVCAGGELFLNANAQGGTAPYSFAWSGPNGFTSNQPNPIVSTNAASNLAGTYTLTITDALGCAGTSNTIISISPLPTALTPTVQSASVCANGSTNVVVPSSQSDVGYMLFNNANDAPVSSMLPGNGASLNIPTGALTAPTVFYVVAQNYATGCEVRLTPNVSVAVSTTPVLTTNNIAICSGSANLTAASVTAGSTGGGTLTYWTNATATAALSTPSAVASGTYYIKSTVGSCFDIEPVSVIISGTPVSTFSYTGSPFCSTASDPIPAYSGGGVAGVYSSSAGLVFVSSSTGVIDLSASTPGTYTVTNTITPSGACIPSSTSRTITITAAPSAQFNYTSNSLCQTIGGTNPMPILGQGAQAGTFTTFAGLNLVSASTGEVNLATSTPGNYAVINTIAAANGCPTSADTVFVQINPYTFTGQVNVSSSEADNQICAGQGVNLYASGTSYATVLERERFNGSFSDWTVTTLTGTNAQWSLRPDNFTASNLSNVHTNDNSQFYLAAARLGSGTNAQSALCSPALDTRGFSTLSLDFYHYYDYRNSSDYAKVQVSTNNATWVDLATYTSDIPATLNASAFVNQVISLNSYVGQPSVYIRFLYYSASTGANGRYWAIDNVSVTGNSTRYTYDWSSVPVGFSSVQQNPSNVQPAASAYYDVSIMNMYGCVINTTPVPVIVNPLPLDNAGTDQNICAGTSAILGVSGVTGSTYAWSPSTGLSSTTASQPNAQPASALWYTLTETITATGCSDTNKVYVNVKPLSQLSNISSTVCSGGTFNVAPANGVNGVVLPGTTYTWSAPIGSGYTGGSAQSTAQSTISQTLSSANNASAQYTVTPTIDGCDGPQFTVQVDVSPTSNAGSITGAAPLCAGSNSTALTTTGYTGNLQWQSSTNGTIFTDMPGETSDALVINNLNATQYYRIKATSAPCPAVTGSTTTVFVRPVPSAGSVTGAAPVCVGTNSITLSANSTIGNLQWYQSADDVNFTPIPGAQSATYTASNLSSTRYYRVMASSAPCASATGTSVQVTAVPQPVAGTITGATPVCAGANSSVLTVNNSVGGVQWQSSTDNTNFTNINGAQSSTYTASNLSATTYYRVMASNAPCANNTGVSVAVSTINRPTGLVSGNANVCQGESAEINLSFTGTGPWSGSLSDGQVFTSTSSDLSLTVTPSTSSTLAIASLQDANCAASTGLNGSATVTVYSLPQASITGSATLCGGSSGTVNIIGTPNAEVEYEINGSLDAVQLNAAGIATLNTGTVWQTLIYSLEHIDDGTCENDATGTATITYQEAPDATITGSTTICPGASATIVFQGNPNALVTYNLNGNGSQTATLNGSGTASVTTGAVLSQTTVNLESVAIGACVTEIGTNALIQVGNNTYYQDSDGDGFGNSAVTQQSCTAPAGFVSNASDCCDSNADINPMTEWWGDLDGDGQGSFIYETGCMAGVNCSTNSWSSQLIPYYPLAHGGVAYVTDCNDANALVSASASELCTTSYDDDCDGMVNEGCSTMANDSYTTSTNITLGTNTYFPNCVQLSGTLLNTDVSPQGNPNNVAPGGGRDVWYKFTSPSTAVQIKLNASGFNGVLELKSNTGVELNVENAVAGSGTEIMNYSGLIPGQQYYLGVRNYSATNGSAFQLCVSPLMPSGCALATPLNGFNLCNSYKAIYRGATSYTFNFTGVGGTLTAPFATTSATTTGIVALSMAQLGLRYGGVYNVRVDANYQLVNGAGVVDPTIVVVGSSASANCSNVLMQQQPFVEVTSTQVCPASLNRTSYLTATASVAGQDVCSATSFTFELTRVSDCGGTSVVGLPMYVNSPSAAPIINLAAAFPTAQSAVGFWRVRVRPNFGTANGSFGPSKIIQVNNSAASGMIQEDGFVAAERKETTALSSAIYPNPNEGSAFTLQLDQPIENGLQLRVVDAMGKLIMEKQFSGALGQLIDVQFDQTLSNGVYHIEVISEQNKDVHRLVVTH